MRVQPAHRVHTPYVNDGNTWNLGKLSTWLTLCACMIIHVSMYSHAAWYMLCSCIEQCWHPLSTTGFEGQYLPPSGTHA